MKLRSSLSTLSSPRRCRMNIAQGLLPFQLVEDTSQVLITSFGGLPLVMETFRALGLAQSVQKHLALHEEEKLLGRIPHEAFMPEETEGLQGLEKVNRDLIRKAALGEAPWRATIDMDALIIESDKREAFYTYQGGRGYQPVIAYWAEQDLVVADQFRDGNVPAGTRLKEGLQKGLRALPSPGRVVSL